MVPFVLAAYTNQQLVPHRMEHDHLDPPAITPQNETDHESCFLMPLNDPKP
jgi:hypothetical protein